eukprot:2369723-Pleurochrysis_carterae.AAC.2
MLGRERPADRMIAKDKRMTSTSLTQHDEHQNHRVRLHGAMTGGRATLARGCRGARKYTGWLCSSTTAPQLRSCNGRDSREVQSEQAKSKWSELDPPYDWPTYIIQLNGTIYLSTADNMGHGRHTFFLPGSRLTRRNYHQQTEQGRA